ncbi:MAG: TetR/AcrR family transcriptional regulator [Myxococcota bacterium]
MATTRKTPKTERAGRRGAGRPRSEQSRRAILNATLALLESDGYRKLTVEAIAARAGVGKQTIYRWWRRKADVVLEAWTDAAAKRIPEPDTGELAGDLALFVGETCRRAEQSAPLLCALMAEAQLDEDFSDRFGHAFIAVRRAVVRRILERGVQRGELAEQADLELLIDLVYGPMWYRLLNRHGALDRAFVERVCSAVIAAGRLL